MVDAQAVIIRDDAGTEHEFPAGFDPKRAAGIVRDQTTKRDAAGVPLDAPRDARGQIITSAEEQPSDLTQLLGPYAHPQTLTDFARLLMLPVDQVRRAAAATLTTAAARSAGQTVRDAASTIGGGITKAGGAAIDAVDADLLSIASPRAGAALKKAQQVRAVLKAKSAAAPPIPEPPVAAAPTPYQAMATDGAFAGDRTLRNVGALEQEGPGGLASVTRPAATAPTEFQAAQAARQATKNALPDQKALNEAALAARRQAYAASQQGVAPGPIVAASGKMQLTAPEMKEFSRLVAKGMKLPDALEEVKAMRELAARLGGPSSTEVAGEVAARIGNRSPNR